MENECNVCCCMNLRESLDIKLRCLLVESMSRSDRYSERVYAGLLYEECRFLRRCETATLLLSKLCDVSELCLYVCAERLCHLDNLLCGLYIFLERLLAGVDHD